MAYMARSGSNGTLKNTADDSRKGRLCRNFALGYCPMGEHCRFSHILPVVPPIFHVPDRVTPLVLSSVPSRKGSKEVSLCNATQADSTVGPRFNTRNSKVSRHASQYQAADGAAVPPELVRYRDLSYKTAPCRHFLKNKGWCPLGQSCNFIHDYSLQASLERAEQEYSNTATRSAFPGNTHESKDYKYNGGQPNNRSGNDRPLGSLRHCWAFVQGYCRIPDCRYLHPQNKEPYKKYTPCLAWPNCGQLQCPFKHPTPAAVVPPDSVRAPVLSASSSQLPTVARSTDQSASHPPAPESSYSFLSNPLNNVSSMASHPMSNWGTAPPLERPPFPSLQASYTRLTISNTQPPAPKDIWHDRERATASWAPAFDRDGMLQPFGTMHRSTGPPRTSHELYHSARERYVRRSSMMEYDHHHVNNSLGDQQLQRAIADLLAGGET